MGHYLLTGCAGFIASNVAKVLLDQGHLVTGIDDMSDGYDPVLKHWRLRQLEGIEAFRFERADIRDIAALGPLFDTDFDGVISLAARAGVRQSVDNPWIYVETNYGGTLNLLELCKERGVGKFVLASTSSVYGNDTIPPFKEDAATSMPLSPYASTKKAAETLAHTYHHLFGIDVTVLRFFTVYGPAGRPDMSVYRFTRAIAEDMPIHLYGDGGERDYTHVDDIALGVAASIEPVGYEIINLGSDNPARITRVISIIENTLGKKAAVEHQSRHSADVQSTWADITKAARLLDWRPQTGLETGVEGAVKWYMDQRDWAKDIVA
ncbi:MAG: GDP-mannose 4,6-dehydratase [SAR202 cluster bacterium]|jgi:nucleoside-diphosphate-sugar epimerase|nr:GDP-mannose 4,6-dehydratase [SAR202 cluster bacterium]MDP6300929.1 GDP-mannose 4,6-dehydratase [SAR202 cluster bacterium]MDP7103244.1 GDP-mannose 4,6-dehydratase [SAR202 cluster bacterium]MDP7224841.1 GDP-mannose 4,6-dehydratase [SAR202 cluster bacterium]MDP7412688.1 GDP-mannose 4,6-dehydratase [SAR202 cluster bacterium]|tara:strand:+ start:36 stop:1001 length:966 start_codon:yes stop_codon:yes gene_type:complete